MSLAAAFASYPFDDDAEYQEGLKGITESGVFANKTPDELAQLLVQTKLFFWNRKTGNHLTLSDLKSHHVSGSDKLHESEPTTLTLAQIKELIEQGRTEEIPNNKEIPHVINAAPASVSTSSARSKPWETLSTTDVSS